MAFTKLPPLQRADIGNTTVFHRWLERVQTILGTTAGIGWEIVEKTGSNLTDIETRNHNDLQTLDAADAHPWDSITKTGSELQDVETRPHSQLQSVLQADEDATDTDAEKHLTNLLAYEWERNKVRTRSVSADTTAVIGEHLSVDCSGGDVTVTLPAAADNTGYPIWLHKSDSSGYRILTSVKNINYQNSTMHLVSNGTDWVIS